MFHLIDIYIHNQRHHHYLYHYNYLQHHVQQESLNQSNQLLAIQPHPVDAGDEGSSRQIELYGIAPADHRGGTGLTGSEAELADSVVPGQCAWFRLLAAY